MKRTRLRPTVLVIDDDRQLCELLSIWLSDLYDVEVAFDGEDGVEACGRVKPDVVLLDVMMPKLSGFSLAWVFKHDPRYRDMAVFFITALDVNRRSREQTDGFLKKPFTRSELLATLRRSLDDRPLPGAVAEEIHVEEMSDGNRRAPRVAVDIPATLELEGAVLSGAIRQLSPWGAFFASDEPIPLDRSGRMRFASGDGEVALDTFPIYKSSFDGTPGVGLRIHTPEMDVETQLFEIIEKHLPEGARAAAC